MKTKMMTLVIVALAGFAINANAQLQDDARIKVFGVDKPGSLKLIHAIPTDQPVIIDFTNAEGDVITDKLSSATENGIARTYDLRKISNRAFRMRVRSENVTMTYQVAGVKNGKKLAPQLEKVEYHNTLAAN